MNLRHSFLVLYLGLLIPVQAAANTLHGLVVDASDNRPLAGARITLAGTNLSTTANADGTFYFASVQPDSLVLTITHVGYETRTITLSLSTLGDRAVQVEMTPDLRPVAGVIVTARSRHAAPGDLGGSAAILSGPALMDGQPLSIAHSASIVPGVSLGQDMPWSARPHVRGLSRDHVAFLVNGNRVSTTTELAAQYGTVPPADVERLEILKGPVSVLYGTGSTGGVVNVIPHSGRFAPTPRWSGATSTGYESGSGGLSGYARIGLGMPRLYLMLSQSYRDYGPYVDGRGDTVPNSQFRDYQTHLNAGYQVSATQTVDVRYQWFEARDVGIPGAGGIFPVTAKVSYPRTRRQLAEATWTWRPVHPVLQQSEIRLFRQSVDRRVEVEPNIVSYLPATDTAPLRRVRPQLIQPGADHDTRGFRWNHMLALGDHDLVVGLEGWEKELQSLRRRINDIDILAPDSSLVTTNRVILEDRSLPNSTYRPLGGYIEHEFPPTPRLTLNSGLRLDVIQIDSETTYISYTPPSDRVLWHAETDRDYSFSAQFRATHRLRSHWKAHLNLARSFRSPGLEERFLYVDLGSLVRIGDPALDSENGYFVEGGLSARTSHLVWNGQAYVNRIRNMVIETPAEFEGRPARRKTNAGNALLLGGETDLAVVPHRDVLLTATAAYVRGTDTLEDDPLPAIPPFNARLAVRYGQRAWYEAAWNWKSAQNRVAPGEQKTPGYRTLSLTAGRSGLRLGPVQHRFTLSVENLLDQTYSDHLATSRGFELNAPGRHFSMSWSTEF